jgi:hypothetical protein
MPSPCVHIHDICTCTYAAYKPPLLPHVTSVIAPAPEDVEHPVGRRREAHVGARGGAGAGGRQRRPGVDRRAEAVHVVAEACVCVCACICVCVCVYRDLNRLGNDAESLHTANTRARHTHTLVYIRQACVCRIEVSAGPT